MRVAALFVMYNRQQKFNTKGSLQRTSAANCIAIITIMSISELHIVYTYIKKFFSFFIANHKAYNLYHIVIQLYIILAVYSYLLYGIYLLYCISLPFRTWDLHCDIPIYLLNMGDHSKHVFLQSQHPLASFKNRANKLNPISSS